MISASIFSIRPLTARALGHNCSRRQFSSLSSPNSAAGPTRNRPPRESSFERVVPQIRTHQHRLLGSSCRPDGRQCPPLPVHYLDAHDDRKFDPATHQRNDSQFDPIDGKPPAPVSSSSRDQTSMSKFISWEQHSDTGKWCLTTKINDSDSRTSYYSKKWIDSQVERWRADADDFDCSSSDASDTKRMDESKRNLWSNWTESMVRDPIASPILFQYDDLVVQGDDAKVMEHERLLKVLYRYGIALITGTPTHTDSLPADAMSEAVTRSRGTNAAAGGSNETAESAINRLASIIGYHPLQTLYGARVWSTSCLSSFYRSGCATTSASTADSAYGTTSLPLHTDMTYIHNPPGAQVFLMVQPATIQAEESLSSSGNCGKSIVPKGQSFYVDGFAAAQQLLSESPEAFRLLATAPRRYRCIDDDEGWHLEATGPVIETMQRGKKEWGPVKSIRHNDLDRLPDLPPYPSSTTANDDINNDSFYYRMREAHEAWDDILSRDSMRLVIYLQPGDCVLVANQRCLHGRYAFETTESPRVVMGCYVGMDELSSKWRKAGLKVP
jgi:alpha-ketoglutarate-dependent taurine dioxygenase